MTTPLNDFETEAITVLSNRMSVHTSLLSVFTSSMLMSQFGLNNNNNDNDNNNNKKKNNNNSNNVIIKPEPLVLPDFGAVQKKG